VLLGATVIQDIFSLAATVAADTIGEVVFTLAGKVGQSTPTFSPCQLGPTHYCVGLFFWTLSRSWLGLSHFRPPLFKPRL
jgi:hypothetical protein